MTLSDMQEEPLKFRQSRELDMKMFVGSSYQGLLR